MDPALPRYGTDSLATASRVAAMDPTLPRDGTDSLATASRVAAMDPTLPRDGTDSLATASRVAAMDPTLLPDGTDLLTLRSSSPLSLLLDCYWLAHRIHTEIFKPGDVLEHQVKLNNVSSRRGR